MSLEYGFDAHGGFFVIDHEQRRAAYAYDSSPNAKQAKKTPFAAAKAMAREFNKPLPAKPLNSSGVSMKSIGDDMYLRMCEKAKGGW